MVRLLCLLVPIWMLFIATATALAGISGRHQAAFYIETYGEIAPSQNPRAAAAHQVFQRVNAVADRNARRTPRLVVVDSKTDAWAIALPSGHIILSRHALDLCFKDADEKLAAARLAFILGHELAHLAHDDYWHQEVEEFMAGSPDAERIAHFLDQSFEAREAELAADDKGYVYAAMAGFAVDRLLDKRGKGDFFAYWMEQTQSRVSASHPYPEDRAELLRRRLAMLKERVGFFNFGVRLAHFGNCQDGVYFLQEFQKVFPGRAVLNNLGVCHLQMARSAMKPDRAWFYWLPFLLDVETRAAAITRGGGAISSQRRHLKDFAGEPEEADAYLEAARDYLQRAVEADPAYLPARLNLAAAYLYLGRPHQARAVLSEALKIAPDQPQAALMDALALYEQSGADVDLWPSAVARLEKGLDNGPEWEFNLASLLAARPRAQEAQNHWNRLAAKSVLLPPEVRSKVCALQDRIEPLGCLHSRAQNAEPLPWQPPFANQGAAPLTPSLRQKLFGGWQSLPFDWFKPKLYGFIHQDPNRGAEVLEMNQFIQLQKISADFTVPPQSLQRYCPHPINRMPVAQGEVFSCPPWAALIRGQKIAELWWMSR